MGCGGRMSNPYAVTALWRYSVSYLLVELRLMGVTTQGTPGSTCHQQVDFHGADNGWLDNTLAGDSSGDEVVR